MSPIIYYTHASVCVCVGGGVKSRKLNRVVCCCSRQQMESVNVFIRPGGSSQSSHCGGRSCYKVLITVSQSSIRRHFPPNRFLIDHRLTDQRGLRTDYLWAFVCQAPMKSALSYWQLWFGFIHFPFCAVLMPGPERERDRGSYKEAVCVLISSADE